MSRAPRQGACFHGGIALDADRGFAAWVTRMAVSTLVQGTGRSMVVCSMGVGIGAARQGRCLWTIRQRAKCRFGRVLLRSDRKKIKRMCRCICDCDRRLGGRTVAGWRRYVARADWYRPCRCGRAVLHFGLTPRACHGA